VAKKKKKIWITAGLLLFVMYFFAAPRPVPRETVLKARWLTSLDSDYPVYIGENSPDPESGTAAAGEAASEGRLLPFTLGGRFGYVDSRGHFAINRSKTGYISLDENFWSEYGHEPDRLEVNNPVTGEVTVVEEGRGYPLFLDGRIYLIGIEGNSLAALDEGGNTLWTYDFAAPLTCAVSAGGIIATGSLDGVVEVLNTDGKQLFSFKPGGSRLEVILGCAVSRDGSRLGIISGIDDQRFLLLERFGDTANSEYKVVYHEFLEDGFRREVLITFIEDDNWIVFERERGLGVHRISARRSLKIPLDGAISVLDGSGGAGLLFLITSAPGEQKKLIALKLPGKIIMEAPFSGETAFLGRSGRRIYTGGRTTLASFELEKQ
jgi:hypothetical protein